MTCSTKKESIIQYRILFTVIILLVYLLGRAIPLYGIDVVAVHEKENVDVGMLLEQVISGDANRCSLFALGIAPYMTSSILVQLVVSILRAGTKQKISPRKMNQVIMMLTMLFALIQALNRIPQLSYTVTGVELVFVKITNVIEMVTGALLILWLADRNKKYGFGKQTLLIYVNIVEGVMSTLGKYDVQELVIPLLTAALVMMIIMVMESTEKRIPVQRISIHNIYADKNYLAIKLNTVGAMPVMFATAVFMLPRMIVDGLSYFFPENLYIYWWQENLDLAKPLGIVVYIMILYLLTMGFAMIMINPGEITEQMLKGGDSIPDFHAGKDTKRYLTRELCLISFFSATVMSVCLGVPMFMQLRGGVDPSLAMFPASIMMLTSMWYNLNQEFLAVKSFDAYQPFI